MILYNLINKIALYKILHVVKKMNNLDSCFIKTIIILMTKTIKHFMCLLKEARLGTYLEFRIKIFRKKYWKFFLWVRIWTYLWGAAFIVLEPRTEKAN